MLTSPTNLSVFLVCQFDNLFQPEQKEQTATGGG